jgi:4-hydroxy-tetrahydrodipicolinate synthase
VTALIVMGSSGESGALSEQGRIDAVEAVVSAAASRVHVMAGVPALGTNDAVQWSRRYEEFGAHSVLVSLPYVFTPSETEMLTHFSAVREQVGVPVVAYDVPSRVGADLPTSVLARLASDGVLAGVKDSSNNLGRPAAVVRATAGLHGFVRYTGSEEAIAGLLLGGFDAAVPGLSMLFPHLHVQLAKQARAGDWEGAGATQRAIVPLLDLYGAPLAGASPTTRFFAAVKEALRQRGIIAHNRISDPFLQPDEGVEEFVRAFLAEAGAPAP